MIIYKTQTDAFLEIQIRFLWVIKKWSYV